MRLKKKIIIYLIEFILVFSFFRFVFPPFKVASHSMSPTISKGDFIITSRLHYFFTNPERMDIVLLKPDEETFSGGYWIHRVIAIPGDHVSIKNGIVSVNGEKLSFPYTKHEDLEIDIQEGYFFQKGDGEKSITGVVSEEDILGKMLWSF